MRLAALKEGDIVDIVAPASKCDRQDLTNGVKGLLELGLVPRVPKDLFASSVLFSNSDKKREAQLRKALDAPDSKMIWCARGGYGALRLIPAMSTWKKPKTPKIILGYSDITTLHSFINTKWGWPTLHGPLLDRFGRGAMSPAERRQLLNLLFGHWRETEFVGLKPLNAAARRRGLVRGQIVGGNMAVLQSGLRTASELNPKGKILFFEDTGERPHRVDRMLTQFAQAGWFRAAKAVVLGHFLLSDPTDRRHLWSDVFPRFARDLKIPLVAGLPVGHNLKKQMTLPLNTSSILKVGGSGVTLTTESGIGGF